jgi:hypothetical protein
VVCPDHMALMGPPMEVGDRVLVEGMGGEIAFIGMHLFIYILMCISSIIKSKNKHIQNTQPVHLQHAMRTHTYCLRGRVLLSAYVKHNHIGTFR